MILYLTYYYDTFAALVAEINVNKDEEILNKTYPDLTDDRKCVNFKASSGLGAGTNKLSLLDNFWVTVDNLQNLQCLFQ